MVGILTRFILIAYIRLGPWLNKDYRHVEPGAQPTHLPE